MGTDPVDLALMRARRAIRKMKHSPFIAVIVDQGTDKVDLIHTAGISREDIATARGMLDALEASLPA